MSLVCCIRPGRICFYCIQGDICHLAEWCALVIHRSILNALPCPPICLAGLAYLPMPFYLNGVGVQAKFLAGMPLYRGHEVVDLPYCALVMQVCTLPPLVGGATCVLGNFWRTRQDNPDLSMDHMGAPRPTTNTVAPDTTTPAGPNTADNALSSYVAILLNIVGVRRLCIEQCHNVAQESVVCCVRPGRSCCIRLDGICRGSCGAHVIHR